jgi:hypothetical protein
LQRGFFSFIAAFAARAKRLGDFMTKLLKNPAEYAAQLNDCYGSQRGMIEIIADLARAHQSLPLEYVSDVFEELCKFDRTLVNEQRSGAIARMMRDMNWDRERAALEYETDPAQRF